MSQPNEDPQWMANPTSRQRAEEMGLQGEPRCPACAEYIYSGTRFGSHVGEPTCPADSPELTMTAGPSPVEDRAHDDFLSEARRKADRERMNNAVKAGFAVGVEKHVMECPICIMRHPKFGCEIGRILWVCAENGLESDAAKVAAAKKAGRAR
jgi:hypothetical protein